MSWFVYSTPPKTFMTTIISAILIWQINSFGLHDHITRVRNSQKINLGDLYDDSKSLAATTRLFSGVHKGTTAGDIDQDYINVPDPKEHIAPSFGTIFSYSSGLLIKKKWIWDLEPGIFAHGTFLAPQMICSKSSHLPYQICETDRWKRDNRNTYVKSLSLKSAYIKRNILPCMSEDSNYCISPCRILVNTVRGVCFCAHHRGLRSL